MKLFKLFKWWYFVVAFAIVITLSLTGVMNSIVFPSWLGRSSALTAGQLPCSTVSDCPAPSCFGSFSIGDKSTVTVASSGAEKAAASLGDAWYDMQGNLKEVQCISGKCQTSPFCAIEYSDITGFLKQYPLAWVKEFPWLFILIFAMLVVVIWATRPERKSERK